MDSFLRVYDESMTMKACDMDYEGYPALQGTGLRQLQTRHQLHDPRAKGAEARLCLRLSVFQDLQSLHGTRGDGHQGHGKAKDIAREHITLDGLCELFLQVFKHLLELFHRLQVYVCKRCRDHSGRASTDVLQGWQRGLQNLHL